MPSARELAREEIVGHDRHDGQPRIAQVDNAPAAQLDRVMAQ